MDPAVEFFQFPQEITHKQYEALRAFYLEGKSAAEVAQQFGYTLSTVYSLTRDFNQRLKQPNPGAMRKSEMNLKKSARYPTVMPFLGSLKLVRVNASRTKI